MFHITRRGMFQVHGLGHCLAERTAQGIDEVDRPEAQWFFARRHEDV